jgi:hypothetical protein
MSLYSMQKLLFHLARDEAVRRRYDAEREAVLAEYGLSAEESRAFRENDVGELYAMGAHPLLLIAFGARAGLAWPQHIEALRRAEPRRKAEP